jgi:transposase InsO family protein
MVSRHDPEGSSLGLVGNLVDQRLKALVLIYRPRRGPAGRLELADHGLRLQVPLLVGLVVDPLVPTKEPQESTTVTPAEIIYHRRVQILDRAGQTSVTEACRTFGVSRTTYYRWAGRAQRYGLAALLPKGRRPPVMPTATPPDQVEAVLAEAVARPTLGARQLVGHLADRGVRLSPSGVQKLLVRHRLGRRAQRVAALAQLTAATTGILTAQAKDGPFGFCHFAARPGDLVALDTFYVGKLKGIGPVWQLTAVDTATRYAIGRLVAGDKSARDAAAFVDHVAERLAGIGVELTGVLTDNGPEFTGTAFTSHLEHLGVRHRRIPPRSPNHNAVCERFQGTALQEYYRPAFHRQHFGRLVDLNAQFQGWLQHYNTRRRNHGDFMRGRTPFAVMEAHLS